MTAKKSTRKKATSKKAAKKTARKTTARKQQSKPASPGDLAPHMDHLRQVVHSALAGAGIHGLSLLSMQFASAPECPAGQHAESTCTKDAAGNEICTWNCVPN
jgi:hypothetical protein